MTDETYHHSRGEVDTNMVGVFTSREAAVKYAKVAMANVANCEDVFDEDGNMREDGVWAEMEDYLESGPRRHRDGDVLFRVVGGEGDTVEVRMIKSSLDKDLVAGEGQNYGSEEESE